MSWISTAPVAAGATWNRDGVILHPLVPDSPIVRTSAEGAAQEPVTNLAPGQTGHRGPVFLADGQHFVSYAAGTLHVRGVHLGELENATVRRLVDADAPAVFAPPDHLLYVKHSTLLAHRLDPQTITLVGEPVKLPPGPTLNADLWALPLDGDRKPFPVLRTRFEDAMLNFP